MKLGLAGVLFGALGLATAAWAEASKPGPLVVKPGEERTFAAGALRPGSTVTCVDREHTLSVIVPTMPFDGTGSVWAKPGTQRFHLNVNINAARSAIVRCGLGGTHW